MPWTPPAPLINATLEIWEAAQRAFAALWQTLGLSEPLNGQAAWPLQHRLAAEALITDASLARSVLTCALLVIVCLVLVAAACAWKRARWPVIALVPVLLLAAPWPAAHLVLAPAVASSFQQSDSGFTANAIARGKAVYEHHCIRCHGANAAGEGPDAAALPMWPPNLTGSLLWRRLEGELWWRVQHGLQDRKGQQTMPGFAKQLSATQTWEVLDYLQAVTAGQSLQLSKAWIAPVHLPAVTLACRHGGERSSASLRGQRLLVVFPDRDKLLPAEDPRFVTVVVGSSPNATPECATRDADMRNAMSEVLGVATEQLAGIQLLVDKQGWLRARSLPGQPGWSQEDLLCKTGDSKALALSPANATAVDGLDALIRQMDAEPVQRVRGGYPH